MIYSKKLSEYSDIFHCFTTRLEGNYEDFLRRNETFRENLFLAEQIHEDKLFQVRTNKEGKVKKGVDGILTKTKGFKLAVRTADCLPLLFYEPKAKIIAAVHAGWRGTLLRISQKMVQKVKDLGGDTSNIIVVMGPHIGKCCYSVSRERGRLFEDKFGRDSLLLSEVKDQLYLDLERANYLQLLGTGLLRNNIEVISECTFCNPQLYFSFRRDKDNKDGEMLAIIGLLK